MLSIEMGFLVLAMSLGLLPCPDAGNSQTGLRCIFQKALMILRVRSGKGM